MMTTAWTLAESNSASLTLYRSDTSVFHLRATTYDLLIMSYDLQFSELIVAANAGGRLADPT